MDRKSIIILIISFGLLLTWPVLMSKVWPPKPVPHATNVVTRTTNQVAEATNVPVAPAVTNIPSSRPAAPLPIPPGTPEKVEVVTNENARYTFTSYGGGLKWVELLHYPESVACHGSNASANSITLNTPGLLPVLALRTGPVLDDNAIFQLTPIPGGVRAEKQLSNGLFLVKEFKPSTNYLLQATVSLENRTKQNFEVPAQEWTVGTATPLKENPQLLGVSWYNGSKEEQVDPGWFANRTLGCFPGTPRTLYQAGMNNVAWAAVHNQFFTLVVIPKEPASKIIATEVQVPQQAEQGNGTGSARQTNQTVTALQAGLIYPGLSLAPNQSVSRQFHIYAGPKEYRTLERIGLAFNNNLDLIMGYSGFFGFFAKLLLLSMNALHGLGLSYALAIIAITVIIKALFWPLTQASTRSMKRMQALQPQIKALQEKFKDDPAKMNRKMMEFMKEHKVNPMGGCLPMLIQIPVFFGFYRMIQNAIELRGAQFLWICDLSKPDTIFMLPGLGFPVNPLPLIMGATMLWQARMTPLSPGMDPVQQKVMKYMPMIFLVMLYNFSAGLTLYWTVQNLLTILQMKLTKTKDDSAAGKAPVPTVGPKKK